MEQKLKFVYLPENILQPLILFLHYTENKKRDRFMRSLF